MPIRQPVPWHEAAIDRDDSQTVDGDLSFVFTVFSVKVRRRMICEVHLDDDAIEAADFRHAPT